MTLSNSSINHVGEQLGGNIVNTIWNHIRHQMCDTVCYPIRMPLITQVCNFVIDTLI
jgi:hypothetical protein